MPFFPIRSHPTTIIALAGRPWPISSNPELLEPITDFVETGFGAGFVEIATRGAADTNRSNRLGTNFYSDRAL